MLRTEVILPVRYQSSKSARTMKKLNYLIAVLLGLCLLGLAAGEPSTIDENFSDTESSSVVTVPLSLIEEIDSWSSSYIEPIVANENISLFSEVEQDYMNLHFSVRPISGLDLKALQDKVLLQIGELLGSDQFFSTAAVIACTQEDLVMYLQLRYTITLDYEHQKKVIKTMYNAVEIDGYLGQVNVFHLYVQNTRGSYVRVDDMCDFDGCPKGLTCTSAYLQCVWNCSLNPGYCPKKSECVDRETNGFYCRCDHDTISNRCDNGTDSNSSTRLGSPWTNIGIITGSILLCFAVVFITAKVLHVYYKKQAAICRNHHQDASDFENGSTTTAGVNDTTDMAEQAECQFLLPMESDLTALLPNGNSKPNVNGDSRPNAFLLVDNHGHF
ncbi:uncharacterized protein LOC117116919 [Anneissia japonica]|uniref:uncharacterized protein LOC117116919 n=1 Tax=Anneissia japonica TaxID=1529436 RepID=UPI00142576CC|nr:uncharacterized protein LOC117116919 [Anneissia japonica]